MKPQIGKRYLLRYWEEGVLCFDIVFYIIYFNTPYWEFAKNGERLRVKESDEIICLEDTKFEKISL